MALYRCAACGSPNVVSDFQKGGIQYNYVKGAVGTVILGAGGAAAGISNETQTVYKCPDCGLTMTYPMVEDIKILIDAGVNSVEARNSLTLCGVNMPWEYFTEKYRNIESGSADALLKAREEMRASVKKIHSQELRCIADDILKDIRALQAEVALMDTDADDWKVRQSIWEITSKEDLAIRAREYEAAEQKLLAQAREEAAKRRCELNNTIEKVKRADETVYAEKKALMEEQSGLGLFKGKRKKEIAQRLQELEAMLSANSFTQGDAEDALECLDEEMEKITRKNIIETKAKIDKKYPVEKSPADHRVMLEKAKKFFDSIKTMGQIEKGFSVQKLIVYKFIEHEMHSPTMRVAISRYIDEFEADGELVRYPVADFEEVYHHLLPDLMVLFNESETFLSLSGQYVSACLQRLVEDGVIATEDIRRNRYYYIES